MTFLPAGVLQQARNLVNVTLPDTCTIQRKSGAIVNGSPSKAGATYTDLHTNVPCRVRDYGSADRPHYDVNLIAGQVSEIGLFIVLLSVGTDVLTDDQIVVNGKALLVLGTDAVTSWIAAIHALVREVGA